MAQNYIQHLEQKFAKKADELKTLGVEMDTQFKADGKFDDDTKAKFDALLADCQQLKSDIENLQEVGKIEDFAKNGGNQEVKFVPGVHKPQTLGDQFVSSDSYKSRFDSGSVKSGRDAVSVEIKGFSKPYEQKATFDTSGTGLNSTVNYQYGPVMVEQQPLTIADLFAQGQTTLNAIPFIKETSFTNAADMVAEGGEKPEATFATEAASAPVKKIAVLGKVTDEMFADFPMMRDYVNNRLVFMVKAKEEQQLLNGTGSGAQITGVLQTSGIQTQAMGGDTAIDAIHKAKTKIRTVGFFEPDAVVVHPNDWEAIRLAKDANSQYYAGGPFGPMYGDTIWGLKVVVTTAITEGTALVGAFKMGAQVWRREGITIEATNTHEDDFAYNLQTIRVEERLALTVYRVLAFCTVTGI